MISRREILAATAAGAVMSASTARAASFGNPDEPPQGAINAKNPASITDPGPQNQAVAGQFPSAVNPPATDVGSLQMNWGVLQQRATAHPERRVGASGNTIYLSDFRHDLGRQHATDGRGAYANCIGTRRPSGHS